MDVTTNDISTSLTIKRPTYMTGEVNAKEVETASMIIAGRTSNGELVRWQLAVDASGSLVIKKDNSSEITMVLQ